MVGGSSTFGHWGRVDYQWIVNCGKRDYYYYSYYLYGVVFFLIFIYLLFIIVFWLWLWLHSSYRLSISELLLLLADSVRKDRDPTFRVCDALSGDHPCLDWSQIWYVRQSNVIYRAWTSHLRWLWIESLLQIVSCIHPAWILGCQLEEWTSSTPNESQENTK